MSQLKPEKILADALAHGIVVLSAEGVIEWYNTEAEKLLHLQVNSHITQVFSDDAFKKFLMGGKTGLLELFAPDNAQTRLSCYLRPYLDDQKILIIQDITQRYRLEKMRQDFIANVSHELRTPLTVFRGYLEMLLDNPNMNSEQLVEIFKQMNQQDQRMERLVKDLLLLSNLEAAEPDLEKHEIVNVASMIRQIHTDAESIAKQLNHTFVLELDNTVLMSGEPHELRSAFSNIIINAVRYTPANGKITIKWYRDSSGKHFEVIDTGIGIEAKHIDRITQRFYRVDKARSRDKGGTGLGLAIVKHVLIRHHGELAIHSKPGEGSTFRFTFPA